MWEDAAGGPAGDAEATNHLRKKRFKKIQIIFLTGAKNKIQFKKKVQIIFLTEATKPF